MKIIKMAIIITGLSMSLTCDSFAEFAGGVTSEFLCLFLSCTEA